MRGRRDELERAALDRAYAVSDPATVADPQYAAGLRTAVSAAIAYGIEGIGAPPERLTSVPTELLAQARQAARNGVSLDTVLRRYFGGYSLLCDFIVQGAEDAGIFSPDLQRALRAEAALFDRLVAAVSEEHRREDQGRNRSSEERRAKRVRMLLAGEDLDTSGLDYDFDAWHVGALAVGPAARAALKDLATALDRRLLAVNVGEGLVWAWLGGGRRLASSDALRLAESRWPADCGLALGEPGEGLDGWRLTHRQAGAAHPIALRTEAPTRYADVVFLSAILRDELLATSLHVLYLAPLERERDGGQTSRQTLRVYFATDRNVSSAAAALGVSRNTVANRLCAIEERLGRSVKSCAAELEAALRLEEFRRAPDRLTA